MSEPLSLDEILFGEVEEGSVSLAPSDGEVPREISGVFYMNGPAHFRRGEFTYRHWLDGDGLIRALRLEDGKAEHTMRFVRSKKFNEESEAGRPLYRAFGTAFEGDRLRRRMAIESPVNVSISSFGGKLLAFGEQALPWEISPGTLETAGECNFNRKLIEITPLSAHPKIDGERGLLCNFGFKYRMGATTLCYWEFDTELKCRREIACDPGKPYSVHDFTVSDRFASFYLSPYFLNSENVVRRGESIHEALEWRPEEENRLLILPRNGEDEPRNLSLGQRGYCLHLINSFEEGEELVIDLLETVEPLYPQYIPLPELFPTVKSCAFVRVTVNVASWEIVDIKKAQQEVHLDFPALLDQDAGLPRHLVWTVGMPVEPAGESKYYDRLLRFDWEAGKVADVYHAPPGSYLAGEPSCVRKPGESDAGYVICPMWKASGNESEYLIFDAFDLAAGPVGALPLPSPCPLGFHSIFSPLS